jgi:hypothetical protein
VLLCQRTDRRPPDTNQMPPITSLNA